MPALGATLSGAKSDSSVNVYRAVGHHTLATPRTSTTTLLYPHVMLHGMLHVMFQDPLRSLI